MQAWPEVFLKGLGWVRFSPTPETQGTTQAAELPPLPPPPPPRPDPIPSVVPEADPAPGPGQDGTSSSDQRSALTLLFVVLAACCLVVLLTISFLRSRLRLRRRRVPDPERRVLGAWYELEDALVLAGARLQPGTASDTSDRVAQRIEGRREALRELAALANTAAFGPRGSARAEDGVRAWDISDEVTRLLRRKAPPTRRWAWWLRLAPLRSHQKVEHSPSGPAAP